MPSELLTPTTAAATSGVRPIPDRADPDSTDPDSTDPDSTDPDSDADGPGRPDWRDAEFGGAFPDTNRLKVLNSIARRRIQPLRDEPTAESNAARAARLTALAAVYRPDPPPNTNQAGPDGEPDPVGSSDAKSGAPPPLIDLDKPPF